MKKIGLIAAIRQEVKPLLERFPTAVRSKLGDLHAWHFQLESRTGLPANSAKPGGKPLATAVDKCPTQCMLVESGIGMTNASLATAALLEAFNPEIVLNIGFCGALKAGIFTGDLVLAEQLFIYSATGLQPIAGLQSLLPGATRQQPLYPGTFISTEYMVSKNSIAPFLEDGMSNPVLEMESAAVFRSCYRADIRFAAVRAVSDAANEDPFLLVSDIIGPGLHIDKKKALLALLKHPGHLPQLFRLARNAHLAGESLADAVSCILEGLTCD